MTKKSKGYSLERYCRLTLEYNHYHAKRNSMSYGIEDIVAATNGKQSLWVQCKNQKKGKRAMSADDKEILRRHAEMYGAIPIYLYTANRKKYWINLSTGKPFPIKQYTDHWYHRRNKIHDTLAPLKDTKKGGSVAKWNKYVLANWDSVKEFIC